MLITILSILGSLVPTILSNSGVIGAKTSTLISSLITPVETLLSNLKGGTSPVQDGLAALGAMSGVIAVLKANTSLPAATLTEINNIDLDVEKALAAYVSAEAGFNPLTYSQITPVA